MQHILKTRADRKICGGSCAQEQQKWFMELIWVNYTATQSAVCDMLHQYIVLSCDLTNKQSKIQKKKFRIEYKDLESVLYKLVEPLREIV